MAQSTTLEIGSRKLSVSNLDKVLYPVSGFTKGQVIDYYIRIAPAMLPHLAHRPLTLKRYPSGVHAGHFYEKRCPSHKPDWITTKPIPSDRSENDINYCIIDGVASLVWVANLASIEMHTLLSQGQDHTRPTMMVFDLDPGPPANVLACGIVGLKLREVLREMGLESFVKTSGGKGLHLYVPLNVPVTFDQTKHLARELAQHMQQLMPQGVVSKMSKALRAGKVFVDWSQNDDHKTTVCVYSLRAREQPTVSTPITWDELEQALRKRDEDRLVFEADAVLKRVEKLGDLFAPVLTLKQKLPSEDAITRHLRGRAAA